MEYRIQYVYKRTGKPGMFIMYLSLEDREQAVDAAGSLVTSGLFKDVEVYHKKSSGPLDLIWSQNNGGYV